jgi:hypothetical protein
MAKYRLASDGMVFDQDNNDLIQPLADDPRYQAYLAWAENNTPDPAVPVLPAVPPQVTRWQAYSVMLATPSTVHPPPATLFSDVQAIAQATGGTVLLAWANQGYVYRHGPFVASIAAQLNLTDDRLDALFTAAAAIPP